jgi:hypothetical protein
VAETASTELVPLAIHQQRHPPKDSVAAMDKMQQPRTPVVAAAAHQGQDK